LGGRRLSRPAMGKEKAAVKKVTAGLHAGDGGSFVRLILPYEGRRRMCAPCVREHNLCCEGACLPSAPFRNRPSIHLLPIKYPKEADLTYPALKWLRTRVSEGEWAAFIGALDAANLSADINCAACMTIPCAFPCLCCQPCCCFIPFQYAEGQRMKSDTAINLAIAKFNRYLFLPRGIIARRQRETHSIQGDDQRYDFIRLDLVPPPQRPLTMDRGGGAADPRQALLSHLEDYGLRPGTMKTDLRPKSRAEWLKSSPNIWPCQPECNGMCAMQRFIPEPKLYLDGIEPEIEDQALAGQFAAHTAELYAQSSPRQYV